jgi:ATP-dependent Clp protease ATP-binding subunit ClpB
MDVNRLTQKAQEALGSAHTTAARFGHQQVDVEHLLSALLEQEGGLAPSIVSKAEIDLGNFTRRVEQEIERIPRVSGGAGADQIYITARLNRLLAQADDEAK